MRIDPRFSIRIEKTFKMLITSGFFDYFIVLLVAVSYFCSMYALIVHSLPFRGTLDITSKVCDLMISSMKSK